MALIHQIPTQTLLSWRLLAGQIFDLLSQAFIVTAGAPPLRSQRALSGSYSAGVPGTNEDAEWPIVAACSQG